MSENDNNPSYQDFQLLIQPPSSSYNHVYETKFLVIWLAQLSRVFGVWNYLLHIWFGESLGGRRPETEKQHGGLKVDEIWKHLQEYGAEYGPGE